jgi:glycosyltransferase involved in cell wall biosynthesis
LNNRVSIITPSYNQADFLEETILSVLNQDYKNIEYIIIDGGSTDRSVEIIKKYERKITFWVSEKDNGQGDAINKGFSRATGDFLCWLNSDDIIYPEFITIRLDQFYRNPGIDLIYGDVDQGEKPGDTWLRKGAQTNFFSMLNSLDIPIPQQSAIWRRKVLEVTGILDPKWHVLLDRDFFVRISKNHDILYIPGSLAFFRTHKNSKSINESLRWAEELPVYYKSLIKKWTEYYFRQHNVMARCYWICSIIYSENNDLSKKKEFRKKSKEENRIVFSSLWLVQFIVNIKHRVRNFWSYR